MRLEDIRSIAREHGIKPNKLSKTELIKCIQIGEGNFDCFATAYNGECSQAGCCWREDCFEYAHKGELT
jgi:hypothetical protein